MIVMPKNVKLDGDAPSFGFHVENIIICVHLANVADGYRTEDGSTDGCKDAP